MSGRKRDFTLAPSLPLPRSPSAPISLSLIAVLLLAVHLWLGLAQLTATSPTFDEAFYIARGWAWWRTGRLFTLGHPALASQIAGIGALLEPHLPDVESLAGWEAGDAEAFSEDLLWARGVNAARIIFLTRAPFLLLSVALGALTAHWARRLYGPAAGLVALALHALSPNVLANAPLAATDLLVAALFVAAWFAFLRALRRPRAGSILVAGVLLGLAQASKFSAAILGLPIILWVAWRAGRARSARVVLTGAAIAGCAALTLWASYAFEFRPYPLASYFADLEHVLELAGAGHWAYLLGRLSPTGWWYYHPIVLLVKTPLPLMLLLSASAVASLRGLRGPIRRGAASALLLPAGIFLAATMVQQLNVGYRYLLPMLPLLHIFAAGAVRVGRASRRFQVVAGGALAAWSVWGLAQVHPSYLAYFNELADGPDNGWRVLADSNLDWGQSLPALAQALRARGADHVFLSYFGQAEPRYFGINYTSLPGWPPPRQEPDFDPLQPDPGLYAISTSNLVGVQMYEPNALAWFRARAPDEVVDHTFFIYDVPARDEGKWFYQCAAPVPLLDARAIFELTGRTGLAEASFDCRSALLAGAGAGWVLLPEEMTAVINLDAPDYVWRRADGSAYYRVYYLPADWRPPIASGAALTFGDALTFRGASVAPESVAPGESVHVTALWEIESALAPPVSIFAHLLAPDGTLAAAGDALGAPSQIWRPGDRLIQQHILPVPPEASPGDYVIMLGLYRLDTGERYRTEAGEDGVWVGIVRVADE